MRVIVIATRFDDMPARQVEKEVKPIVIPDILDRKDKVPPELKPAPTPEPILTPPTIQQPQEEDPFDTIFKIFNSK